jgi:hypothetical protein
LLLRGDREAQVHDEDQIRLGRHHAVERRLVVAAIEDPGAVVDEVATLDPPRLGQRIGEELQ